MFNKILASSKIIQFIFGVFVGAFMGGLIGTIMHQQTFGVTAGAFMGLGLGVADRIFKVESNPFIAEIEAMMPGSNCGQCGFPGCRPYATAIAGGLTVAGKLADPSTPLPPKGTKVVLHGRITTFRMTPVGARLDLEAVTFMIEK